MLLARNLFVFLCFFAVACRSGHDAYESLPLEFIHDRVTSLHTDASGVTWIGFGAKARVFAILSHERELLAVAEDAKRRDALLHATVRKGHPNKAPEALAEPLDPRRVAVVRLSPDPDPRR